MLVVGNTVWRFQCTPYATAVKQYRWEFKIGRHSVFATQVFDRCMPHAIKNIVAAAMVGNVMNFCLLTWLRVFATIVNWLKTI